MKRRIRYIAALLVLAGVVIGGRALWMSMGLFHSSDRVRDISLRRVTKHTLTERVDVIGGSIAHGWKDPNRNSYLKRAFQSLTAHTPTQYQYIDRTIVGADGAQLDTMYWKKFLNWLDQDKPQIVVISWGLLNDAKAKTSMDDFRQHLRNDINAVLARHAVAIVVSPPITKASYTQYQEQQQAYVDAEMQLVKDMNNPNVYAFDVFGQMKQYLAINHQTWQQYYGDGWHPNSAGHALAGQLLFHDLVQTFGDQPIVWQNSGQSQAQPQSQTPTQSQTQGPAQGQPQNQTPSAAQGQPQGTGAAPSRNATATQ
ncbi:MAG: SGNH/GDSL hydrolase family protein [Alicyclobacillus sp.]|nr:SGNH/GDSL hydrolase family protein [Alicyclobacillus sp.]